MKKQRSRGGTVFIACRIRFLYWAFLVLRMLLCLYSERIEQWMEQETGEKQGSRLNLNLGLCTWVRNINTRPNCCPWTSFLIAFKAFLSHMRFFKTKSHVKNISLTVYGSWRLQLWWLSHFFPGLLQILKLFFHTTLTTCFVYSGSCLVRDLWPLFSGQMNT